MHPRTFTGGCLFALLFVLVSLAAAEGPVPPFLLDCGPGPRGDDDEPHDVDDEDGDYGERSRAAPRIPHLRDRPYTRRSSYGYEGGEGFRHWFAGTATIWGRPERGVFSTGRAAPESYRFDLAEGTYIVALGFCELEEHRPGRRVFDVAFQDGSVERAVDPFAIAGYGQSFRLARIVEVRGREGLRIRLRRRPESRRSPFVNAIWVHPLAAPRELRAPPNLRGHGSYGMNVLFWDPVSSPEIGGAIVERRAPEDREFRVLTPEPVVVVRWIDRDVTPGISYRYRVRAVDVRGRRGPPSPALSLAPRAVRESSFPVYSLSCEEADLDLLYREVQTDRTVPATFRFDDNDYPVRVRIRGAVSRHAAKLSYHVTFVERSPFGKRRIIYLKAEPRDSTLQQTKLTCDVFETLGTPAGAARYINLLINGDYQGVYLDVERIDRPFLERKGMRGTLFRADSFQRLGRPGRKRGSYGSKRELPELIRAINRLDRGEFESFIRTRTDWPKLRDYLVTSTVCHRSEIEANDFFYCHLEGKRWFLMPWDHNNGNFGVWGSDVRRPFMPLYGQTLQGTGHWNGYWHVLPSRIFHQDRLRRDYLDRLESVLRELSASGGIEDLIAANHTALRSEIIVDPYRWPPGNDAPFRDSRERLTLFVRQHAARLLELLHSERQRAESPLVINEFQLGARGGWVEIHNRGDTEVVLEGCSIGGLDGAYHAWHRFRRGDRLAAGAFRVVRVEYPARTQLRPEEDDAEWIEALERAELEGREPPPRAARPEGPPVPGGTVALVGWPTEASGARDGQGDDGERPHAEEPEGERWRDDRDREPVLLDWYFFGHQSPGFSYGRSEHGFGFMTPTPGAVNGSRSYTPPSVLLDGGRRGHRGKAILVYALLPPGSRDHLPHSVTLHYSFGGPWREVRMEADTGRTPPRFVERIQTFPQTTEIKYYFVARSEAGLERLAPLTAPVETYRHGIDEDD